jgi:hypothetical protein
MVDSLKYEYFDSHENTENTDSMANSSENIDNTYKTFFVKFKQFYNSEIDNDDIKYKKYLGILNIEYEDLTRNKSIDMISKELWLILKTTYEMNTLHSKSNAIDKETLISNTETQDYLLNDSKVSLSELEHLNATNKRQIEININLYDLFEDKLVYLRKILFLVVLLIIVPILRRTNTLTKKRSLIIYFISLIIIGIIYLVHYFRNINKDDSYNKKYNFTKPDANNAARSKALLDLSSKDRSRCQALQELESDLNYDMSSLDLNIDKYRNTTSPSLPEGQSNRNKCSL